MPVQPSSPWSQAQRFDFGGIGLVDTDLNSAVEAIVTSARARTSQGLHLCNAYTLTIALRDPAYHEVLNHPSAVNLPDGTPVSWFYRLSSRRRARGPVRGPSLMKAVLAQPGLRHFLLGGTQQVLDQLEARIAERYPTAVVAGTLSPRFGDPTEADIEDFATHIRKSDAAVVWVGLGTPRQDIVISRLIDRVDAVLVGVGAAFDFISGRKPEAPEFLHRTGLEWTYRLASEPRRLWRRYLIGNSLFIAAAVRQLPAARRLSRTSSVEAEHLPAPAVDHSTPPPFPRVAVGGARVHCVDEATVLDTLAGAAISGDRPWLVVTPNIQHIALLEKDADLRSCFQRADLVLADGWPVVRAARLLGGRNVERITGADLFPALCERAARHDLRVGIIGGMDGAAEDAAAILVRRYPGLRVVHTDDPVRGFEADERVRGDLLNRVRAAELDLLFLALGTPKQENFAARYLDDMSAGVTVCVGAAVDFVAGRQRRAPRLLRRFGLEWAFRAVHQPRRLLPRYAKSAPVFLRAVLRTRREPSRS